MVVGVGGVGAWAAELICRAGVGAMTIVDADVVSVSNINRQLPATHATVGLSKVAVMAERLRAINPSLRLTVVEQFVTPADVPSLLSAFAPDGVPVERLFVVDAIDTVASKCALLLETVRRGIPVISSMGSGAKRDITKVQFATLGETYHCGLSRAVRNRLKQVSRNDAGLATPLTYRLLSIPVVFSSEQADPSALIAVTDEPGKRSTNGTVSYLPATFGCYLAEYVILRLAQTE